MSCLQKNVHKIKHIRAKTYKNAYVWSDAMGSQFRSRYIFNKFGQLVVHSPLEFSDTVTKFVPSIHSVYFSENIIEPEDI